MKLIIEYKNLREDKAKYAVDKAINAFRKKWIRNLKVQGQLEKNQDKKSEIIELKNGFEVHIIGEEETIKKEFLLFENNNNIGKGTQVLGYIGLHFNYYVLDDEKNIIKNYRKK